MSSIFTGTVYKIICSLDENTVYIGSTFNQPRHRWQQHKNNYKRYLDGKERRSVSIYPYFQKYGIENFKIIRIKQYECYREHNKDLKHLHAYEQLWINKTRCVNMISAFSIPIVAKEYQKKYYENNREKNKEYQKEYRENNRDKILEYQKEWRINNREEILKKKKEYRENNREEILKKKKEYYEKNKRYTS